MKRVLAAVFAVPVLVLTLAAPAAAAKPNTDAQGCENTQASHLDDYCTDTGG